MKWLLLCTTLLLCTATMAFADDRRSSPFSTDEHWEGERRWSPNRDGRWREQQLPDKFTIDEKGKCEIRCERIGREYRCRQYRC